MSSRPEELREQAKGFIRNQSSAQRKILHLSLLIFAFLLFSITWYEAAGLALIILGFDLFVLPQWGVDLSKIGTIESSENLWTGIVLYPVAILILALVFRHTLQVVAAAWALLAAGDGMAGLVGERWGSSRLPFNRRKTWEGFVSFIAFGGSSAWLLLLWTSPAMPALKALVIGALAAVLGAIVEALPIRLNDNISVPLVCGGFIVCAGLMTGSAWDNNVPYLGVRITLAAGVNLAFALVAWRLRQITLSGAVAGFLLGVAIYTGYGYKTFLILLSFFVLGALATRLGYAHKLQRGIAEQRRGARSWREATANLLSAGFLSILAITTPYASAFLAALVAALAEAAGDTVASEIGKWRAGQTYLVTTLKPVAPGENGGVSAAGTAAGFGASILVVALGYGLGLCGGWNAVAALLAAWVGNIMDSLLGATLERRGLVSNGIVNFVGASLAGGLALAFALPR